MFTGGGITLNEVYEEITAYKPAIRYSSSYALLPARPLQSNIPFQIDGLLPLFVSRDTSSPQVLNTSFVSDSLQTCTNAPRVVWENKFVFVPECFRFPVYNRPIIFDYNVHCEA